jgi:hypothetical protein
MVSPESMRSSWDRLPMEYRVALLTYLCVLVKDKTVGVDVASLAISAQHRLGSSQNETPDWHSHLPYQVKEEKCARAR